MIDDCLHTAVGSCSELLFDNYVVVWRSSPCVSSPESGLHGRAQVTSSVVEPVSELIEDRLQIQLGTPPCRADGELDGEDGGRMGA